MLPAFDLGFVQAVTSEGATPRVPIASLDDHGLNREIRRFSLPPACRKFTIRELPIPESDAVIGHVSLTPASALQVVRPETRGPPVFYELSSEGATLLPPLFSDFNPVSMVRAQDGDIYMLGFAAPSRRLELRAGTPSTGFRALPPEPSAIYLLDQLSRVECFDGTTWSVFQTVPSRGTFLAWSSAAEVIVSDSADKILFRVDAKGVSEELKLPF